MATKGKDEIKETTPISKKLQQLRSESSHIGVVTGSPIINNKKKKKSIKHHTNKHQSSSGDTSSVARKLESDNTKTKVLKNKKKRSSKSTLYSDTSSVSSIDDALSVARKPESNKTTTKLQQNKKKRSSKSLSRCDTLSKTPPQLMAHQIDWTNSSVTRTEIRKYPNTDHIDETQEAILPHLLHQFKPNDIKTSFAVLISKSNSNTASYYPLPQVKAKLIESFVKLILDTKSMMVSSSKKPSR